MSTRSNIGVKLKDGSVKMVYCHFDGYPSGVGKVLLDNFKNFDEVEDFIAQGDMSSLHGKIGEFYTARGDSLSPPKHYVRVQDAIFAMQEYMYLFDEEEKKWFYSDHEKPLVELTSDICEKDGIMS